MPGFSDNLRRARESAGLSAEDLASRVGAAPLWLTHLEAIDASLPELPHLVKLAEALGCPIDQLLAGGDEDFDHPRRRHAALIAARLGRISALLARVNASRARGEFTPLDERQVDEASMLSIVHRCRGWVTSPTADLTIAGTLEAELDKYFALIEEVYLRVTARMDAARARVASGPSGRLPVTSDLRAAVVEQGGFGPTAAGSGAGPATPGTATAAVAAVPPPAPPRSPGHATTMWTRPASEELEYVCEMVTSGGAVELRLLCGERVLATKACKNLDEAFGQSSTWKRIPDPSTHFTDSAA